MKSYIKPVEPKRTSLRLVWSGDYAEPSTFLDLFVKDGPNNNGKINNVTYDKAIKAAEVIKVSLVSPISLNPLAQAALAAVASYLYGCAAYLAKSSPVFVLAIPAGVKPVAGFEAGVTVSTYCWRSMVKSITLLMIKPLKQLK